MKICCISDTHGKHDKLILPEADVLVHAGDLSGHGYEYELKMFLTWFSKVGNYEFRIFIAGNHDWVCFEHPELMEIPNNVIYLQDNSISINGYMFYGTPWQPIFLDWAFNLPEEQLQKKWDMIPSNTDVLITHCPAFGILDIANDGTWCGSPSLNKKIQEIDPLAHICGHIHEAYGTISLFNNTTFVNASVLNRRYILTNDPILIDITK